MSTNKSQNLNLHLWVPEDDFLRTEFNENFSALDSAVKADRDSIKAEETARKSAVSSLQSSVSGKAATSALNTVKSDLTSKINEVKTIAEAAKTAAEAAYCPDKAPYACGHSRTGDVGAVTTVEVGFKPSCVLIVINSSSALYVSGNSVSNNYFSATSNSAGFTLCVVRSGASYFCNSTFYYVAFR